MLDERDENCDGQSDWGHLWLWSQSQTNLLRAYSRVRPWCRDVVNEFYQHAKGSEHVQLIQLMEIHALVMIQFYFDFFSLSYFNTFVFVSFV